MTIGWEFWVVVLMGVFAIAGLLAIASARKNFPEE